ncbi:MAG: hypothetical protein CMI30_00535 [Opitutae bacterium]|nr:hypothetical protein [Rhodospirillaceae bacterium]MBL61871.1 hypothetical protein [Opitutae bacterium]|tara:strand:- start:28634 stop:31798 length:3165 start_codon:yes stop_codon:yes gene_type:complete
MKNRCFPAIALTSFLAFGAHAQLVPPPPKPIVGARHPALSPNGKSLAFVYRGDIWGVSSAGGRAMPLTSHLELDAYPIFSPDGKWIAFGSLRNGNWDIFIMPAIGGPAMQLTWHSGHEIPFGWSPDSRRISFSAKRNPPRYGIFTVDIQTRRTGLVCEDYAIMRYPRWSPNGKQMVYGRFGFPWYRPRYTGSAAAQIWLWDTVKNQRAIVPDTDNQRQHLYTQFTPDGKKLLTVTTDEATPNSPLLSKKLPPLKDTPAMTPNLWLISLDGKREQLTNLSGDAVRYPSMAKNGDIAFEYKDGIWMLPKGADKPKRIPLLALTDSKRNPSHYERIVRGVTEAEPSPDGKHMAFGLKGDIWVVRSAKPKGNEKDLAERARRLTRWAGDDSDFSWSHDSKKIYFTSDREGNNRIYEVTIANRTIRPLWKRQEDVTRLRMGPDGKFLFCWVAGPEGGLHRIDLKDSAVKRIIKVPGTHSRGQGGVDYEWSPDLKWIAFTRRGKSGSYNIWITPYEGGKEYNITLLNATHSNPAWSPDGRYLFFQSNRSGDGLYAVALREEDFHENGELKFAKPKGDLDIKIDFNNIHRRIRKVSSQNPDADLNIMDDGRIFFLSGNNVWKLNYDGSESKKMTDGGGHVAFRVMRKRNEATFMKGGEMFLLRLGGGPPLRITFAAEWTQDIRAERLASFQQFWRTYHHRFYDASFHGRDWKTLRDKYGRRLSSVDTDAEFAALLSMLVGELETSHCEVTAKPPAGPKPTTPHLGLVFDYSHQGTGIKINSVPAGSPPSFEKTRIKPGEYLLGINGELVTCNEKLYDWLNRFDGKYIELLVNSAPKRDGARTVRYKLLTWKGFSQLNYRNQVAKAQDFVAKKSGGKIGYVHIPGMGETDQRQFEREVYEYIQDKDAIIFDVRFNGGGRISDNLIDMLERKQHGIYVPRDGAPEPAPGRAWHKPIVVIMNEHSYSNAEMFPYAIRQRGLGRLVGMPTPGYVIWTSTFTLTNGTRCRIPGRGVWRMDGTNMENQGEKPDLQVWMTPAEWLEGKDPQLEKAIEMLQTPRPTAGK